MDDGKVKPPLFIGPAVGLRIDGWWDWNGDEHSVQDSKTHCGLAVHDGAAVRQSQSVDPLVDQCSPCYWARH